MPGSKTYTLKRICRPITPSEGVTVPHIFPTPSEGALVSRVFISPSEGAQFCSVFVSIRLLPPSEGGTELDFLGQLMVLLICWELS